MSGEWRATYLLQSEVALLNGWGRELKCLFDETAYLVGSALERADHRDVDVRIMLDDDHYDEVASALHPPLLNLALSLWGQKATGLAIDCQVQRASEANEEFDGRRHPIGMERLPRTRPFTRTAPETPKGETP